MTMLNGLRLRSPALDSHLATAGATHRCLLDGLLTDALGQGARSPEVTE